MNRNTKSRLRKAAHHLDKALDSLSRTLGEVPVDMGDVRQDLTSAFLKVEGVKAHLRWVPDATPAQPDERQVDIEDLLKAGVDDGERMPGLDPIVPRRT